MERGYKGRNAKVDANQKAIVDKLNKIDGVTAISIGKPFDLLVGVAAHWYGELGEITGPRTWLIDIKNPDGKDKLTPMQLDFMADWSGQQAVCRTFEEVLQEIGVKWYG